MKKKFLMVILALVLCISSVSAYFTFGYNTYNFDIIKFYQSYYQIIDLLLYFLFFSAVANLTIGARFKDTNQSSTNILTFVFGFVLSLILVFVETTYYHGPMIFQQTNAIMIFILLILVLFAAVAMSAFIPLWFSSIICAFLGWMAWKNITDGMMYTRWGYSTVGSFGSVGNWWAIVILLGLAVVGFAKNKTDRP